MTDPKPTRSQNPTAPVKSATPKHLPDPPFKVKTDRPINIVTARGVNAPPMRQHRPLTAAVLATLHGGGSVEIAYNKAAHERLMGRFKGIESRRKELRFIYSLVTGDDDAPTEVRYWCVPRNGAPASAEPVVGRDVE